MKIFNAKNLTAEEIDERLKILQYKVCETQIEKVWKRFQEAGFEPILIKGWAASQLYPEPYRRQFVDIDLAIAPKLYEAALEFNKDLHESISVDLHKGTRHLDSVGFEDLFSNTLIVKCGTTNIRILRPEDHLRVLCVHWLNDGGQDREKLWDIYYAIANRPIDFDWQRLLNIVSLRRRQWIVCAIGLAHRYLQLKIEDTPIAVEAKNLPYWLTKAVEKEWENGIKLLPLHYFLNDKKMLWKQIKKRLPPNPIQATIEVEGKFDERPRIIYQLKSIFPRVIPAFKRITKTLR